MIRRLSGYQLVKEIGRGAKGVVYLAEKDGCQYAIKTLTQGDAPESPDEVVRIRKEAAAMARLSHAGIVKIHDVGEVDGFPFIVTELLEGEPLSLRIRERPLSREMLLEVAKTVAGALGEIHRFRMVHRDIKPENIFVTRNGAIKLVDFGLVGEMVQSEDAGARGEEVVGTLLYSAPEQSGILKRPVDGRSDLYSLGVTLYEACTGKPPFLSDDVNELLQQHATVRPRGVHELNAEIPVVLSEIISKLLEKDPDERYQSAKGLLSDLERIEELELKLQNGSGCRLGESDRSGGISEIPMVGRSRELLRLRDCWQQARQGQGSLALLEGEGGSGKSRLANELISEAGSAGALILRGKCNAFDSAALAPIREAFNLYFNRVALLPEEQKQRSLADLKEAIGAPLEVLSGMSFGLRHLFGSPGRPERRDAERNQELFYQQLIEVIAGMARLHSGLILYLDDVHWLDETTLEFLRRFAAVLRSMPVLVVATARNDATSLKALNGFKGYVKSALSETFSLSPMNMEEASQMISASLGSRQVERRIVEKIAVAANMNPFAIIEYVNAALVGGVLSFKDGSWAVDESRFSAIALSNDVYQLILNRLSSLNDQAKGVLSLAAIAGQKFNIQLLRRASGETEGEILFAVEQALRCNLVEPLDSDTYVFAHDRVREAFVSRLSEIEVKEANDRLAQSLETLPEKSPDITSALAHHYVNGNIERNQVKACVACFEAGRLSLENYANQNAYALLQVSYSIGTRSGIPKRDALAIAETFGVACLNTGRMAQAHEAFDYCLSHVADALEHARLQYWKMRTLSGQGKLGESWELFLNALRILGKPYPKNNLWKGLTTIWFCVATAFQAKTRFGYGRLLERRETEREKIQLMCKLFETGYQTAFFRGSILDLCQITFRQFYFAYYLGTSRELAHSQAAMAILFSLMNMNRLVERNISSALKIAASLGDFGLQVYVRQYDAIARLFCGELAGYRALTPEIIPLVERYLPNWNRVHFFTAHMANLYQSGHFKEGVEFGSRTLALIDESQDMGFMSIFRMILGGCLEASGNSRDAVELKKQALRMDATIPDNTFSHATMFQLQLFSLLESGEFFGEALEGQISGFLKSEPKVYPFRMGYAHIAQARLQQWQASAGAEEKRIYRRQLITAIRLLRFQILTPVHRCFIYITKGALARMDGRFERARRYLEIGEKLAAEGYSPEGLFWSYRERARLERDKGNAARSKVEARAALSLASDHSWKLRIRQIGKEFGLIAEASEASPGDEPGKSARMQMTRSGKDLSASRAMEALLEVSIAASKFIDPKTQAQSTLDTLVRLMGAERACIFLDKRDGSGLGFFAGRDSTGGDLREVKGFSTTVVNKVFEERKPRIVTGTEEGEALGSQSIVAHNLKSIMAVPLLLKDELMGVVYLDSSLAKGLFTESDLDLFSALCTQIAVAVETARMANVEAERREMQKDLAVTAAVQTLFLPRKNVFETGELKLSGFYQGAAQSSGDWWWYRSFSRNSLSILVGDVTGHGPGPAMITAATAACLQVINKLRKDLPLGELLRALNGEFIEIAQQSFLMAMVGIQVDGDHRKLRCWHAGAGPIYVLPRQGEARMVHGGPSASLGTPELKPSYAETDLAAGDRIFVCTDGITELNLPNGSQLGKKKLLNLLKQTVSLEAEQAREKIVHDLNEIRKGTPLADDLTFVVVDFIPDARSLSQAA